MAELYQDSKRNQLANATNPYQGGAIKALCVCSAGLLRSPTIAKILTDRGYNTRACGTSQEYALVPLSRALIHWCDEVYVVKEQEHIIVEALEELGLTKLVPMYALDIPDVYGTFDPVLEDKIKQQLESK